MSVERGVVPAGAAASVLHLIHDHLGSTVHHDRHGRPAGRSWLLRRQLACYPHDPDWNLAALAPLPDVLYALGLTDPSPESPPNERSWITVV